jgi:hypothetical protein
MTLSSGPIGSTAPESKVQAITAEFTALKTEIHGRSRDQFLSISAALAAAGVILGVVANNPESFSRLLLVLPWILGITAVLWCDHHGGIRVIAKYIEEKIEKEKLPMVFREYPKRSTIEAESWFEEVRKLNPRLGIIGHLLPWAFFFLPSILSLGGYWMLPHIPAAAANWQLRNIDYLLTAPGFISLAAGLYMWAKSNRPIKTPSLSAPMVGAAPGTFFRDDQVAD